MTKKLEISRELAERFANSANFTLEEINAAIQELRALLAADHCETCDDYGQVGNILNAEPCPDCTPIPPLIQTLHANGDRIAMEATIAQQAQRIADFERGRGEPKVMGRVYHFDDGARCHLNSEGRKLANDTPLYAEQPAPVAVAPTYDDFEKAFRATGYVTSGQASELAEIAIDKVKELNQSRLIAVDQGKPGGDMTATATFTREGGKLTFQSIDHSEPPCSFCFQRGCNGECHGDEMMGDS